MVQVVELLAEPVEDESCGLQEVEATTYWPAGQADLVDVGCDAEVAELTYRSRYIQVRGLSITLHPNEIT